MSIGNLQRLEFESQFRKHFRDDFQSWFFGLAKHLHPNGDCIRVRVTRGDGGLDCLAINSRRVYQCFAPDRTDEQKDTETARKVDADFRAAFEHLKGGLREWVFVHNYPGEQIGKETAKAISSLKTAYSQITILVWGMDGLWEELSRLPQSVLCMLFGPSLGQAALLDVDLSDIQRVVAHLAEAEMSLAIEPLEQPDPAKLEFNDLTSAIQHNLATGRYREPLVKRYFSRTPSDVAIGERVAESFRKKYASLRGQGLTGNAIFDRLLDYAGWKAEPDAKHQAAVLAVMSYFFHRCDIFENPTGAHDTTD